MLTLVTFGDSVLDCGSYNAAELTPGRLLVRNDDERFPDFRGEDLESLGPTRLVHRAQDGATAAELRAQLDDLSVEGPALALLSIGGNDLLTGALSGVPADPSRFRRDLAEFLGLLAVRPVLVASIYDPTFGDDRVRLYGIEPGPTRILHRELNAALAEAAAHVGRLVDVHAHFLAGTREWFTQVIEPSLVGASEIRRCFWPAVREFAVANRNP